MAESAFVSFTLGSASPRRAGLLRSAGLSFTVEPVDIDEGALLDESEVDPRGVAERIARAKFDAFVDPLHNTELLLTADTLVACDGHVMGKPESADHLGAMLSQMSGANVEIASAVCVGPPGSQPAIEVVSTWVRLKELTAAEIDGYVGTGAGDDKAGGLALQGEAKPFIRSVQGCWSNVLGLPVCTTLRLLGATGHAGSTGCSVEVCGSYDR